MDKNIKDHRQVIGYMRVSTDEQDLQMQRRALIRAGVEPDAIFEDTMSGKSQNRPGLREAIRACFPGAVLVVWKLDRLGRSLKGLLETVEILDERGIKLVSLTEDLDARTPMGKLMMQLLMVLAEFERNLISERTREGLKAKKARDKSWKPGPPHGVLSHPKRVAVFTELFVRDDFATMDDKDILAAINKPKITVKGKQVKPFSLQSYGNWKAQQFKGFSLPDEPSLDI